MTLKLREVKEWLDDQLIEQETYVDHAQNALTSLVSMAGVPTKRKLETLKEWEGMLLITPEQKTSTGNSIAKAALALGQVR